MIIDDVPAYVCNTCGGRYHLARVAKSCEALQRIVPK